MEDGEGKIEKRRAHRTWNRFSILDSRFQGKSGQVAVVVILVVAAALIFYAVSLNLGRMSQAKTMTTIASDTSASLLASEMASYGQAVSINQLAGRFEKCKRSGIFRAIVMAIVAIVISIFLSPAAGYWFFVIMTAVLSVASVVMQATVLEPGLTSSWNTLMQKTMSPPDRFVEAGIQTALQKAVTDAAKVPDLTDGDEDRLWGLDGGGVALDEIGRYGFYYYEERLKAILPKNTSPTDNFLCGLDNFLHDGPIAGLPGCANTSPGWGLYDPVNLSSPLDSTGGCATAECDRCCVPPTDPKYLEPLRSDDCDPLADWDTVCAAKSLYGGSYPWLFDPFYEDPTNLFLSFREQLGRDDEHQLFQKDSAAPNGTQLPELILPPPPLPPAPWNFRLRDTTNFYVAPYYAPTDNRRGVFPFFYKVADWKVNLNVTEDPFDVVNKPNQCHWCDQREVVIGACPGDQPPEIPQLVLDAANPPSGAVFNTTLCVDGISTNVPGNPPLAVDKIKLPDPNVLPFLGDPDIGRIEASADQCAQSASNATWTGQETGFWKKGGDRFCEETSPPVWPYAEGCPKHGTTCTLGNESVDCMCGQAGALSEESWPDDVLDDLVYQATAFLEWAEGLLARDPSELAAEFEVWYQGASEWIEPGTSTDPDVGSSAVPGTSCFEQTCKPEDGWLHRWHKKIQMMLNRLQAWRNTSFASGAGACREVWCIPDPAGCPGVPNPPAPEAATFDNNDTNGDSIPDAPNGIWGDIEDVTNCINWNANNTVNFSDLTSATGNAQKFQACADACDAGGAMAPEKCSNLPRSLVPGVDTSIPDQSGLQRLQGCLSSCNNSNCQTMDPSYFLPSPPLPGDPSLVDFEATQCGTWGVGNVWYDRIMTVLANLCQDPWLQGIRDSIPEATNQVAKFRKRYNFLRGRLTEMDNLIAILRDAENQFDAFLTCDDVNPADGEPDGPACKLTRDRISYEYEPSGLPYNAIYGWQSEPEEGQPLDSGRWHIVKVDARIPRKCDRACNIDQSPTGDPSWPWVGTYTKGLLDTTRCYEMRSTDGVVKTRVTRYDEAGTSGTLLFPNAVEIWQPRFSRSDRPQAADPADIEVNCVSSMVPDPGQASAAVGSYYYGAFILNDQSDNTLCWNLANALLTSGVTSEACAQYYWQRGMRPGMGFKFVPCENF